MASNSPASDSFGTRRSANDRWKKRWSTWVMVSTIVGAVGHAAIFVVIPNWEIVGERLGASVPMLQIDPILAYGGELEGVVDGEQPEPVTVTLEERELEITRDGQGGISEIELTEILARFGLVDVSHANPILRRSNYGTLAPPEPPLSLERVEALTPRLASFTGSVVLPMIRNPTVLQRFLRTRYNPIYEQPDGNGYVSVAMWINERGDVEWTAISQSSGFDMVDEIALEVFNDVAIFTPARSRGQRVPVSVVISVPFTAPW